MMALGAPVAAIAAVGARHVEDSTGRLAPRGLDRIGDLAGVLGASQRGLDLGTQAPLEIDDDVGICGGQRARR